MNTIEVLKGAKTVIQDPANWIQGTYATDAESPNAMFGNDPKAVCFCSIGAIQQAAKDVVHLEAEYYLSKAVKLLSNDPGENIVVYNDTHTHAEVMLAFDKAIELAETGK